MYTIVFDLNPKTRLMMTSWMTAGGRTGWNVTGYRVGYVCTDVTQVERSSRGWNYTTAAGKPCNKNVRPTKHDDPLPTVKGVVAEVGRSKKRRRTIKRKIEYERENGHARTKTHNMAVNDGLYYLNWTDDDDNTKIFIKRNVLDTDGQQQVAYTPRARHNENLKMAGAHWIAAGLRQWRRTVVKIKILYASFLVDKLRRTAAVRRTWRKFTSALNDGNHKHLYGRQQHTTVHRSANCVCPCRTEQ